MARDPAASDQGAGSPPTEQNQEPPIAAAAEEWIPAAMRSPSDTTGAIVAAPEWVPSEMHGSEAVLPKAVAATPVADMPEDPDVAEARANSPDAFTAERVAKRLGKGLNALETGTAERLASLEARIGRMDKRADTTAERFEQRHGEAEIRSKELNQSLDDGQVAVRELGRSQAELAESQTEMLITLEAERKAFRGEVQADVEALRASLASLEKDRDDAAGRRLEHERQIAGAVDAQRDGIIEILTALESRMTAEWDRLAARGDAEEQVRRASEQRAATVLSEVSERLQIQSERLTSSEDAARERAGDYERNLDASVAGLRNEIDETVKRVELVREEVAVATDAVTVKLAEFGAGLGGPPAAPIEPTAAAKAATTPARPAPSTAPLDTASFEDLRAVGLSVTQAARFIAYRNSLQRPLAAADLDRVAGLQDGLRESLKGLLDARAV